jgi:hypothetical protein
MKTASPVYCPPISDLYECDESLPKPLEDTMKVKHLPQQAVQRLCNPIHARLSRHRAPSFIVIQEECDIFFIAVSASGTGTKCFST